MSRKAAYTLVIGTLSLMTVFMGALFAYGEFSTVLETERPVVIAIHPGDSLNTVIHRYSEQGVLRRPNWLSLLAVLRGDSARIKAGEYVVKGAISPNDLLDQFISGKARYASLTIPEGFSLAEIAARLEEKGLGSAKTFMSLARDAKFIATLDLPIEPRGKHLEGFIFPDTYYFHRGVSEAQLIQTMVQEFSGKGAAALLREHAPRVSLTPYEALILASIIEKETGVAAERPLISAVFHNRLASRMRLASDPTVIYGLNEFDGNLKRVHLLTKTPYNTYKVQGLPPTPIANPGLESIRAAVMPAKVDYLFFVSKGDGTHIFSEDYKSHQRAVQRYQVRPHRRKKNS